jgi:DNA-binding NarL/FixJ family response regulator
VAPYGIVLADDHQLIRDCIKKLLLEEGSDFEVIGEVCDGRRLLDLLGGTHPDMVILDLSMPNLEGIEATRRIKKEWPSIKILILTVHKEREYLNQSLEAGADGFLLKDDADSELNSAIETIRQGNLYITPQLISTSLR